MVHKAGSRLDEAAAAAAVVVGLTGAVVEPVDRDVGVQRSRTTCPRDEM